MKEEITYNEPKGSSVPTKRNLYLLLFPQTATRVSVQFPLAFISVVVSLRRRIVIPITMAFSLPFKYVLTFQAAYEPNAWPLLPSLGKRCQRSSITQSHVV
jgi:hypothetical protein